MNLQDVRKAAELLGSPFAESNYAFTNFIKTRTFRERLASKKKLKLLKAIDPAVQTILAEGEKVFYLTQGLRVNTVEQLFVGWVAYYYNLAAFVFTSKRIVLIHLKNNRTRGTYIASIDYSDIRKVSSSLLGNFRIRFSNGKSVLFTKMPKADRVYLKAFLNSVVSDDLEKDKTASDIRKLCPQCFSEIQIFPAFCPSCQIPLKLPKKAALLSLLMPGLGDIYLGSKTLGVIELLFMAFIWFSVVSGVMEARAAGVSVSEGFATTGIVFLLFHPIDAVKSNYLAKKGITATHPVRYVGE